MGMYNDFSEERMCIIRFIVFEINIISHTLYTPWF